MTAKQRATQVVQVVADAHEANPWATSLVGLAVSLGLLWRYAPTSKLQAGIDFAPLAVGILLSPKLVDTITGSIRKFRTALPFGQGPVAPPNSGAGNSPSGDGNTSGNDSPPSDTP